MNSITTHLIENVFNYIGVFFGLITLVAFLNQRRDNRKYNAIIELVELNLDKKLTDKEIRELKSKKSELEVFINDKLPNAARAIILQDQLEFYRQGIYHNYQSYKDIAEKLRIIDSDINTEELSSDIRDLVLKDISPNYSSEKNRNKWLGYVIVNLAVITVLYFLSFEVFQIVIFFLMILLFRNIANYLWISSEGRKEKTDIYHVMNLLLLTIGASTTLWSVTFTISNWNLATESYKGIILLSTITIIGILLFFFQSYIVTKFTMIEDLDKKG